jgi:hypothetical protein
MPALRKMHLPHQTVADDQIPISPFCWATDGVDGSEEEVLDCDEFGLAIAGSSVDFMAMTAALAKPTIRPIAATPTINPPNVPFPNFLNTIGFLTSTF